MHLIWFDLLLVCFTKWLMRARPNSLVTGAAAFNCRALMPVCLSLALIRLPMCSLCNGRHRQKCRQKKNQTVGDSTQIAGPCLWLDCWRQRVIIIGPIDSFASFSFFSFLSFASPLSLRIFCCWCWHAFCNLRSSFFHLMLDFFILFFTRSGPPILSRECCCCCQCCSPFSISAYFFLFDCIILVYLIIVELNLDFK